MMKKKIFIKFTLILHIIILFGFTFNIKVNANYNNLPDSFRFNYKGEAIPTRDTYRLIKIVDSTELNVDISSISNFFIGNSKIYIVDSLDNQIIITNFAFEVEKIISNDTYNDILSKPEGIWVTDDERIYVANAGKNNILIFNSEYELLNTIEKPDKMVGTTNFTPSKIAVDSVNRIYVVVQGSTEGIIELSEDGEFLRYFGTNEIEINLIDYFWRMIATDQQKSTLGLITAPPFNNITISNDFYYTTASDPDSVYNVKKFNSKGDDVLLREGYFPISGNVQVGYNDNSSSFTSISVNDYGILAVLDSFYGHVYVYDNKGYLLSVFGGSGQEYGYLQDPVDVRWFDEKIVISDNYLNALLIYEPTNFGEAILNAQEEYMNGNYQNAFKYWKEVLKYDSNYERAYVGIAQYYYYEKEDYKQAMQYYKIGNDRVGYGIALTSYREEFLKNNFIIIILPIIIVLSLVFYSEYRYIKKSGE